MVVETVDRWGWSDFCLVAKLVGKRAVLKDDQWGMSD